MINAGLLGLASFASKPGSGPRQFANRTKIDQQVPFRNSKGCPISKWQRSQRYWTNPRTHRAFGEQFSLDSDSYSFLLGSRQLTSPWQSTLEARCFFKSCLVPLRHLLLFCSCQIFCCQISDWNHTCRKCQQIKDFRRLKNQFSSPLFHISCDAQQQTTNRQSF